MVGNDGQGVTGRHECAGTVDHVAVTISVRGGTKGNVVLVDLLDQRVGVDEVGVGVSTVEVGRGDAVLGRARQSQLLLKDVLAVRASDTGQAVEEDLEVGLVGEELLDQGEVEDVLQHLGVVGSAVDDLNLEVAVRLGANGRQVNVGDVGDLVGLEGLGGFVDLVGDTLGGGATVGQVVLDTKVLVGTCSGAVVSTRRPKQIKTYQDRSKLTTGVVAGRQEDTTSGLALSDDVAGSRGGQDAILADQELLDAICGTNLCTELDDLGVPESAVTTDDKERACWGGRKSVSGSGGTSSRMEGGDGGVLCKRIPSTPSGIESRMLVTKDSL